MMISADNLELLKDATAGRVDLDGKVLLALIAEVQTSRAVLRDVEWRGSIGSHEGMGEAYCPICGRDAEHDPDHPREHAPGCRLAALLTPAALPGSGQRA